MTKFILLSALLFLVSCSSVINTPQTRMISPEAQGKFLSGSVEARWAGTKSDKFEFKSDNAKEPVNGTSDAHRISGLLDLGLLERLDVIYLDYLSGSTVGIYGLKFQVLGKTRQESKEGNFSLSIVGGYGKNSQSNATKSDSMGDWNSNVDDLDYKLEHKEAGLIVGYRWAPKFLHYANAYYFRDLLSGKVTTDGNALQEAKFKGTQDGMIYSMGASYDLGANWYLKADLSHMTSKWSFFRDTTTNSINLGLGASW